MRVAALLYVAGGLALTAGDQPPQRLNIVGNILLTVPLGALVALRLPRVHPFLVVLIGFATSCTIEVTQLLVHAERDPSLNDIALNTSGTGLGWIAGRTVTDVVRWALRRWPGPSPRDA